MKKEDYRKLFYQKLNDYKLNTSIHTQKNNLFNISKNLSIYLNIQKEIHILIYQPLKSELPMIQIFEQIQKKIKTKIYLYIPLIIGNQLEAIPLYHKNKRIKIFKMDIIITPGLFVNRNGFRLGRGGGYYDRVLSFFQKKTIFVGYQWQVINNFPVEQHDKKVTTIITEKTYWRTYQYNSLKD